MSVSACVCMCLCVAACVHMCVCMSVRGCLCASACVCTCTGLRRGVTWMLTRAVFRLTGVDEELVGNTRMVHVVNRTGKDGS